MRLQEAQKLSGEVVSRLAPFCSAIEVVGSIRRKRAQPRSIAKEKGWKLHADGSGLFDAEGKRIAGDSEEGIFRALELPYVPPEERG